MPAKEKVELIPDVAGNITGLYLPAPVLKGFGVVFLALLFSAMLVFSSSLG